MTHADLITMFEDRIEDRKKRLFACAEELNALDQRRQGLTNQHLMLQGGVAELRDLLAVEEKANLLGDLPADRTAERAIKAAKAARAAKKAAAQKTKEDA